MAKPYPFIPKPAEPSEVFNLDLLISGRSKEELLSTKIKIDGEVIEVKKIKTRHVVAIVEELISIEWNGLTYLSMVRLAGQLIPKVLDFPKEKLLEVELEDWEPIYVQFKEKNPYFLLMLRKAGITKKLQKILVAFGMLQAEISDESESDIEQNTDPATVCAT